MSLRLDEITTVHFRRYLNERRDWVYAALWCHLDNDLPERLRQLTVEALGHEHGRTGQVTGVQRGRLVLFRTASQLPRRCIATC